MNRVKKIKYALAMVLTILMSVCTFFAVGGLTEPARAYQVFVDDNGIERDENGYVLVRPGGKFDSTKLLVIDSNGRWTGFTSGNDAAWPDGSLGKVHLVLPTSVVTIASGTASNVAGITSGSYTYAKLSFDNETKSKFTTIEDATGNYTRYDGTGGNGERGDVIEGDTGGAFNRTNQINEVIFPNNGLHQTIGTFAFHRCSGPGVTEYTGLQHVEFRTDGGVTIKEGAFSRCYGLRAVDSNTSVKEGATASSIGDFAFSQSHQMYRAVFPGNLTTIGERAFSHRAGQRNASVLSDLVIGNAVTSIGASAFQNAGLKRFIVPSSLTNANIGANAFSNCTQLVEVENNSSISLANLKSKFGSQVLNFTGKNTGSTGSLMIRNADGVVFCANTVRTDSLNDMGASYQSGRWYVTGLADYVERQFSSNRKLFKLPDELSNDTPRWRTGFTSELWTDTFAPGQEYDYLLENGSPYKNTISETVTEYDIARGAFGGWMPYLDLGNAVVNIGNGSSVWDGACGTRLSTLVIGENVKTVGSYAFVFRNGDIDGGMRGVAVYMPSNFRNIKFHNNSFWSNYGTKYIIYQNKADYDDRSASGVSRPSFTTASSGNGSVAYTYMMDVNFHVLDSSGAQIASYSKTKVNGIGWDFTRSLNYPNLWESDTTATNALPNLDRNSFSGITDEKAYKSTVWYTASADGSNKFNIARDRNALNGLVLNDARASASIDLYAKQVDVPTLTPLTRVYDGASHTIASVTGLDETPTADYSISMTYVDSSGTEQGARQGISDAGVYTISVTLNPKWGVWAGDDSASRSMTVTVEKAKINLADNNVLSWDAWDVTDPDAETPVGLLGGTLYVLGQSSVSLSPNGGTETVVASSYVRYLDNRTVSMRVHSHEHFETTGYAYTQQANLVGAYDTQATIQIKDADKNNYEFSSEPVEGETRNFGVRVILAADGSATVTKTWYIVQVGNWITAFVEGNTPDEDSPEYTLSSDSALTDWVYGSVVPFNTPDLIHGDKTEIKFTLTRDGVTVGDANRLAVWDASGKNVFVDYFNLSMPAGEYVLTIEVNSLTVDAITYPSIERIYRFRVLQRTFTQAEKDIVENAIKGASFEYLYDGTVHIWEGGFDALVSGDGHDAEQFVSLEGLLGVNGTRADGTSWHVERKGIWAGEGYDALYETVKFTYNLYRMQNNNYVEESYFASEGNVLLKSVGDYTVYYQFSAPSYTSLVNEASDARRASYFNVVVYRLLDVPQFATSLTFTGARNTPFVAGSDFYTIEWDDADDYIHARNQNADGTFANIDHEIVLRSYDKKLYRWNIDSASAALKPYVRLDEDNDENLILTYHITPAENRWTTSPRIVTWRWQSFDKEVNRIVAASYYGADTVTFSVEKGVLSGNTVIYTPLSFTNDAGETVTQFALTPEGDLPDWVASVLGAQNAGNYRLVAYVAETGDYKGLDASNQPFDFDVSKATNTWVKTPNIMPWSWSLFKAAENTLVGLPVYYDEQIPIHFAILGVDGASLGKTLNGYSLDDFTFTVTQEGVYVVNEHIAELLKELPRKSYLLRTWMDGTDNYEALSRTDLQFDVWQANNYWEKSPVMTGWQYFAYDAATNFVEGEPKFIKDGTQVVYYILQSNSTSAPSEETFKQDGTNLADMTEDKFKELSVGQYWVLALAEGTNDFTGLSVSVPFQIIPNQTNSWTTIPSISNWVYAAGGNHATEGKATFGTVTYAVFKLDGTVASVVQDDTNKPLEKIAFADINTLLNLLDAGSYRLEITSRDGDKTAETANFVAATRTLDFTIEKALNAWQTNPAIESWTWGEEAKTPVTGVAVHDDDDVVKTSLYYSASSDGSYSGTGSATAPTLAGYYAYVTTAGESTNYKFTDPYVSYFTISQFRTEWTNRPEATLSWTYGVLVADNTKLENATTDLNAGSYTVDYTIEGDASYTAAQVEEKGGIRAVLQSLGAGTYSITATVAGSDTTYSTVTATTSLTVNKATLVWQTGTAPADNSWDWSQAKTDKFTAPVALGMEKGNPIAVDVTFSLVFTPATNLVPGVTNNAISATALKALIDGSATGGNAGTYEITASVSDPNYNEFTGSMTITINRIANSWIRTPDRTVRADYKNFKASDFILPSATYQTESARYYSEGVLITDSIHEWANGKSVGDYTISVKVPETNNYSELSQDITVTVSHVSRKWSNEGIYGTAYGNNTYGATFGIIVPKMDDEDYAGDEGREVTYELSYKSFLEGATAGKITGFGDLDTYFSTAVRDAGTYTITAKYICTDDNIQNLTETVTVVINRANVSWTANEPPRSASFAYQGANLAIPVAGGHDIVYKITDASGNETTVNLADGQTINDYLNTVAVGSYTLVSEVELSVNYNGISATSTIVVTKAPNGWATGHTPLSVLSMTRGDADITGFVVPQALRGTMSVTVTGNGVNGAPTADGLKAYLMGLAAGTYTVSYSVPADVNGNYDGFTPSDTRFVMSLQTNGWQNRLDPTYSLTWSPDGITGIDAPTATNAKGNAPVFTVKALTQDASTPPQAGCDADTFLEWLHGANAGTYTVDYLVNENADVAGIALTTSTITISKRANQWTSALSDSLNWKFDGSETENKLPAFTAEYGIGSIVYSINGVEITRSLKNALDLLSVGTYTLRAEIAESANYLTIFKDITVTVVQNENGWDQGGTDEEYEFKIFENEVTVDGKKETIVGWQWDSDKKNLPALIWNAPKPLQGGTVLLTVTGRAARVGEVVIEFTLRYTVHDDGTVTSNIGDFESQLRDLNQGAYTITAQIPSSVNWSVPADGTKTIDFEVVPNTNEFITEPAITDWTYGNSRNLPQNAELKYGRASDIVYTYYLITEENGKKVRTPVNDFNRAGKYEFDAFVAASAEGNYPALTTTVEFNVNRADIRWTTYPGISAWTWNEFDKNVNLFVGAANSGGKVTFEIAGVGTFEPDENGVITDKVQLELLKNMSAGTYRYTVHAAQTENYNGETMSEQTLRVQQATNRFVLFKIQGWAENLWSSANVPVVQSRYGDITVKITGPKTMTDNSVEQNYVWYEAVYASNGTVLQTKVNELYLAPGGQYTMHGTVAEDAGKYEGLDDEVSVEIFLSSSTRPANHWTKLPMISNWTAGDSGPAIFQAEAFRCSELIKTFYYELDETRGDVVPSDELNADGYPTLPGKYVLHLKAIFQDVEFDTLETDVRFEIRKRVIEWTTAPNITSWSLGNAASTPVAAINFGDEEESSITYAYRLKDETDDKAVSTLPTKPGNYVMIVSASAKYCDPVVAYVDFNVSLSVNQWVDLPVIEGWSEEFEPNDPTGSVLIGEIQYTYAKADGTFLGEEKPTAAGDYIMYATVEVDGYETLTTPEGYAFTIAPAWDTTLLTIDLSIASVLCILTVVVIVFAIRRYKENG